MSAHEALETVLPADMRAVWAASMMPLGSVADMPSVVCAATRLRVV